MKSFKKSILAAGLALAVVTTIGGVAVFAAVNAPKSFNDIPFAGSYVTAKSEMYYNTAYAYTSYGNYADSLSVESTYLYWDNLHGTYGTQVKRAGHYKSARVEFSAPAGCKSINISSTHKVAKNYQTWTAYTFDDKET